MKTFFNGKKVPTIPPLLFNGVFVADFQEKANSKFFAKQRTLASNNSVLPSKVILHDGVTHSLITFSESDVIKTKAMSIRHMAMIIFQLE